MIVYQGQGCHFLENLEKLGNFNGVEKSGRSQGIWISLRKFYAAVDFQTTV